MATRRNVVVYPGDGIATSAPYHSIECPSHMITEESLQRATLRFLKCVVLGLLLYCVGCFQGRMDTTDVEISGPSMAPTLLGPHATIECPACHKWLHCGLSEPMPEEIVCQHCAELVSIPEEPLVVTGLKVPFRRVDAHISPLDRFDIAVVRSRSGLVVKRIVGLPGEQVGLAEGDLWINGRRFHKSIEQFRTMAVLVDEETTHERSTSNLRWRRSIIPASPWEEFRFQSLVNYLSPKRREPGPICDALTYNASLSRVNQVVTDVLLSFETLANNGHSEVVWELGKFQFTLSLVADEATHAAKLSWRDPSTSADMSKAWRWETSRMTPCPWIFGSVDGRLLLVRNRSVMSDMPEIDLPSRTMLTDEQWKLGVRLTVRSRPSDRFQVRFKRVWRDIYYESPGIPPSKTTPRQLADNEYFVLGDNSANSLDSREGTTFGTITQSEIFGLLLVNPKVDILAIPHRPNSDMLTPTIN